MDSSTVVALDWLQFRYFQSGWCARLHSLKLHGKHIRGGEYGTSSRAFIEFSEGYTKHTLVHTHTHAHTHTHTHTHTHRQTEFISLKITVVIVTDNC
jgi:hypothetical protein